MRSPYFDFQKSNDFESRTDQFQRIKKKHNDRIPVIIESFNSDNSNPKFASKFLFHHDITFGQLAIIVRKYLKIRDTQSLFFNIIVEDKDAAKEKSANKNHSVSANHSQLLIEIYKQYCHSDNLLYVTIHFENTFGSPK